MLWLVVLVTLLVPSVRCRICTYDSVCRREGGGVEAVVSNPMRRFTLNVEVDVDVETFCWDEAPPRSAAARVEVERSVVVRRAVVKMLRVEAELGGWCRGWVVFFGDERCGFIVAFVLVD